MSQEVSKWLVDGLFHLVTTGIYWGDISQLIRSPLIPKLPGPGTSKWGVDPIHVFLFTEPVKTWDNHKPSMNLQRMPRFLERKASPRTTDGIKWADSNHG